MARNLQRSLSSTELRFDMDRERREKSRYPLQFSVRYQTLGMARPVAGIGQTVNVSSGGTLMVCNSKLHEGTRIRLVFEWPSLLNGVIPLHLVTIGTVVRSHPAGLAIAFEGYQFRTAGRRSNVATMPDTRVSASYSSSDSVANLRMAAKSLS
jgi:hypothetical protein